MATMREVFDRRRAATVAGRPEAKEPQDLPIGIVFWAVFLFNVWANPVAGLSVMVAALMATARAHRGVAENEYGMFAGAFFVLGMVLVGAVALAGYHIWGVLL